MVPSPSLAPTTAIPTLSPALEKCLARLINSGFNILYTEKFNEWMDNSTVCELPETGIWTGPVDIAEYISFSVNRDIIKIYTPLFHHLLTSSR